MIDAAKEKSSSRPPTLPGQTRALWAWLCLIVAFCLAGTRAEAFFAPPDHAPGILAPAAPDSTGKTTTAWQYDALDSLIAAKSVGVLDNAAFAQKTFSQTFSSGGKFAGQTIDDVAGALRSGTMKAGDVPIEYIVRDGSTLMLNTRSAQALQQAGIPRAQWNAVNMTGNAAAEARLTGQLQRNGLDSTGHRFP